MIPNQHFNPDHSDLHAIAECLLQKLSIEIPKRDWLCLRVESRMIIAFI